MLSIEVGEAKYAYYQDFKKIKVLIVNDRIQVNL